MSSLYSDAQHLAVWVPPLEPSTIEFFAYHNGADGEFRNLDLRIIVVIVRFELTFPY